MREDFGRFIDEVKRNPFLSALVVSIFLLITSVSALPAYRGRLFDIDPQKAGEFGDFIGGYFGPILSLVGIFFVVLTLREQRKTTAEERKAAELDAFEGRFFELLKTHRDNVTEMALGRGTPLYQGRQVFRQMLAEFQRSFRAVRDTTPSLRAGISPLDQIQVAYYFVYFGVGIKSSLFLSEAVSAAGVDLGSTDIATLQQAVLNTREDEDDYPFFEGHQQKLGHYYRHLYQTVSFVHEQTLEVNKYEYVKILRAQLSSYEQVLLFINSATSLGWDWWSANLMISYGMVKNIPRALFETHLRMNVTEIFPKGYFEWEQAGLQPELLEKVKLI